jgi:hypothetical protein
MRSHGFRKFWNTIMIKARVESNTRHALAGHRAVRGLDMIELQIARSMSRLFLC